MSFIRKVVVGISGGVDSAVTALLLKEKGFTVVGAFMRNWDEFDESGRCSGEKDFADAQFVCSNLGIPLKEVNFVKDYWNDVFWKFLEDYQNGFTPNPDILCNRHIKFDKFFNYATSVLKADAIATGHYASTSFGPYLEQHSESKEVRLLQATDDFKDQTFFLSSAPQEALQRTMFPLGSYLKADVRSIALKSGLGRIAAKRESTGICFIGNRNFKEFIKQYIDPRPGLFIDVDTQEIVGKHDGIHEWTIGQRCRIASCRKPYFIAKKDCDSNNIFVASGTDHPALYSDKIQTAQPFWIRKYLFKTNEYKLRCKFRFQHTKPLVNCTIHGTNDQLLVTLESPLRAITPGQYAVFYLDGECLGSARILRSNSFNNFENSLIRLQSF